MAAIVVAVPLTPPSDGAGCAVAVGAGTVTVTVDGGCAVTVGSGKKPGSPAVVVAVGALVVVAVVGDGAWDVGPRFSPSPAIANIANVDRAANASPTTMNHPPRAMQ